MKRLNDSHLTELEIALTVEALKRSQFSKLPAYVCRHVEQCLKCKFIILDVSSLISPQSKVIKTDIVRKRTNIFRIFTHLNSAYVLFISTSAIFLFAVSYFMPQTIINSYSGSFQEIPDTIAVQQTIDNFNIDSASFVASPNYENLINSRFRSSTIKATTSIVNRDTVIIFRWDIHTTPVTLTILSNTEEVIHQKTIYSNSYRTVSTFRKGLYYWKLEDEGGILFVGKFMCD